MAHQPLGVVEARLVGPQQSEGHVALGHLGVIGAVQRRAPLERGAEEGIGPVEVAELLIDAAERREQLGLDAWFTDEAACLLDAAVHQRDDPQAFGGACLLVAALEQVEHEPLDPLRARCLGHGGVARRGDAHRVENDDADERRPEPAPPRPRRACSGARTC